MSSPRSTDDAGCLLFLFIILWYFGFLSFHSREAGRDIRRLKDVKTQLAKAESQLSKISELLQAMKKESNFLDAQRAALQSQVSQLEASRDQLAINLRAASEAVAPSSRSRRNAFLETLFSGIIGNLLSGGLIAIGGWLIAKRGWKLLTVRRSSDVRQRQKFDS